MKRNIILIISLCLALLCSMSFVYAEGSPTVSVDMVDGMNKQTVDVNIILTGNNGFSNLSVELKYDDSKLKLLNVNQVLESGEYVASKTFEEVPYMLSWSSASNIKYNGILATLTFEILENIGDGAAITISSYSGKDHNYIDGLNVNYDANYQSINLKYKSGAVLISPNYVLAKYDVSGKMLSLEQVDGSYLTRTLNTGEKLFVLDENNAPLL